MSADIVQHWDATNQTTVSNEFRKVDLSDGSPAIAGDVIIFGGICSSAGTEIALATSTLQTSGNAILTTIDADTGNIATSAASIDGKITACNTGAVVVSSSALPSGAATAAKQPALGTAGTASADVITVQGRTGMTALVVDGSAVTQPISGSVTANIGTVGTLATAANQTTGNTSLATLAGAVAGAEMQVDILTMPNVTIAGTVTVAGAVTNAGTFAVQVDGAALTSLQLLDDSVGTVGAAIVSKGLAAVGTDGTNARILKTDTSGELQVDVLTMPTVAVTGTFWQATQPVSAASLPLPTGAATLAEQQTQTTALQLIDDTVYTTNTAAVSKVIAIGGHDDGNTGNVIALQISPEGHLYCQQTVGGSTIAMGNGAAGTTVQRVTIANDSTGILAGVTTVTTVTTCSTVTNITNWGNIVDDAAFTPGTTRVLMVGFEADEASIDSVDEGDGGAARMTLDRKVIVTPQPHTQGGLSIFRSLDLDESEEEVKASAGQIYGGMITNTSTGTRWIKFYNATAANVTVGTTTPVITWGIQGGATDDVAALFNTGGQGVAFDTAITVAATTGVADADTGAPGANDVVVNLFFK